jgi:hypothetical protein
MKSSNKTIYKEEQQIHNCENKHFHVNATDNKPFEHSMKNKKNENEKCVDNQSWLCWKDEKQRNREKKL